MTFANATRLLKHYNDLADGTIPQPFGHKDWADVVTNAKMRAEDMEKRVQWYKSDGFRVKHNLPPVEKPKETKSKGKK